MLTPHEAIKEKVLAVGIGNFFNSFFNDIYSGNQTLATQKLSLLYFWNSKTTIDISA